MRTALILISVDRDYFSLWLLFSRVHYILFISKRYLEHSNCVKSVYALPRGRILGVRTIYSTGKPVEHYFHPKLAGDRTPLVLLSISISLPFDGSLECSVHKSVLPFNVFKLFHLRLFKKLCQQMGECSFLFSWHHKNHPKWRSG